MQTVHTVPAKRRSYPIAITLLLVALAACRNDPESTSSGGKRIPGRPNTAAVLALMPEGAVVAVAIPSVERAEEQVRALLLRGAPEDLDMQAELKVITSQMARSANAFEATTVADIAAIKGIDPEKPVAIFFAAARDDEQATPPPGQAGLERELLRYLGFDSVAPMAAVLPYTKRQDAEKLVAEWGGSGTMTATDLTDPKTTVFTNENGGFAYFFTDSVLVAGTSPTLVNGVAARMKLPAAIRYGTAECPADDVDEIVQLVRTDAISTDGAGSSLPLLNGRMPQGAGEAVSQFWNGWIEPYKGDDPMVVTWNFKKDQLTVRTRLDYAKHPEAKQNLAAPVPLAHLNTLPKSALGVWTIQITPQSRANLKELAAKNLSAQGGMLAQMGESLGKVVDTTGDEATVAVMGPGADTSKMALMIEFKDGDAARALLKELGMTPLKAETYNNTDIYTFVIPPVAVYYAIPNSTFALAGNVDSLKDMIDAVASGKTSSFSGALNPPLDTGRPRQQAFIGKRELFTEALLPALEGYGTITKEQAQYSAKAFAKVRDARLTTEVVEDWQDTRLTVQFE